jgi:subtilisin family serine protease
VSLASIKVIDDDGHVSPEAAICGLLWAAEHRLDITNSSFFVNPWPQSCTEPSGLDVVRTAIARAAEYAHSRGVLQIAAASNEAVNLTRSAPGGGAGGCHSLPASLPDVVAVSALDADRVKAGYSSYGLGVIDLAAPGGASDDCVLSTVPGGYGTDCGTSMAAPHVAGVAALIASSEHTDGPDELRQAVRDRTRPVACPTDYDLSGNGKQDAYCTGYESYNGFYGHGMVDALSAVSTDVPAPEKDRSPDEAPAVTALIPAS